MKKKTMISLILALVMCLGLACPTFAANKDTTPPQWEQYGYESLNQLLSDWGITADEYYEMAAEAVAQEEYIKEYLAANPGATEDEALDAYIDFWYAQMIKEERIAMGGPAEGVGVMLMDSYVQFTDAQPVIKNDRTMIPVRAVAEFTGSVDVAWENGTVILTTGLGKTITFRPGETTATVTDGTSTTTFEMDVAPYIDPACDRTYVPLRFFTQALGFEVYWDHEYQTAVIIDAASIIDDLNSQFTVFNSMAKANKTAPDVTYKTVGDGTGSMKFYGMGNGGEDLKAGFSVDFSGYSRGMNTNVNMSWDMSELIALINAMGGAEEFSAEEAAMLDALGKSEATIMINGDAGKLYIGTPLLGVLAKLTGSGMQLPADTWLMASFGAAMLPGMTDMAAMEDMTFGELIYAIGSAEESISICSTVNTTAEMFVAMLGDDNFVKTADGYSLKSDAFKSLVGDLFTVCDIKMDLKNNGEMAFSINMQDDEMKMVMEVSGDQTKAEVYMLVDLVGMFSMDIRMDSDSVVTTETFSVEPPANSLVIDLDTLDLDSLLGGF